MAIGLVGDRATTVAQANAALIDVRGFRVYAPGIAPPEGIGLTPG